MFLPIRIIIPVCPILRIEVIKDVGLCNVFMETGKIREVMEASKNIDNIGLQEIDVKYGSMFVILPTEFTRLMDAELNIFRYGLIGLDMVCGFVRMHQICWMDI